MLCQEASCPLCGEKCLKFDPPVLVCHGTCLQKVKKNSVYYVTVDGIMLWCQRCYTGLPTVILELPNRPPLLKRNLLKRRLDEEVAEPWVSCDICGHWFHQICALYNDRMSISADSGSSGSGSGVALSGGSSTSTNPRGHYECPLCKLESIQQQCAKRTCIFDGNNSLSEGQHIHNPDAQQCVADRKMRSHQGTVCRLDENECVSELIESERDRLKASNKVRVEKPLRRPSTSIPARAETRSRAGAAKVAPTTSSQPKPQELSAVPTNLDAVAAHSASPLIPISLAPRAVCLGDQSTLGLNDYPGVDKNEVLSSPHSSATTTSIMSSVNLVKREVEVVMDVSDDSSVTTTTICSEIAPSTSPTIPGKRDRDREDLGNRTIGDNVLPAHLNQWRASTLPRSNLSDFLEALVAERLRSSGYEEAADTVTVRMTSNVEQYMEVPATIVDNLRTSEGLCIPPYLAYKQKCILMFQKVDGVDICLFCLYVQEFDEKCPEPNKSVVYIAYLDSVDFFR